MNDFGGKLRQARERRGISLRQIATSTKISPAALDALERNDVSKLPGGIFSRAFVRSYAIEVGLDPEETVREFLERFQGEPPPSVAAQAALPEEESEFESRRRMALVVLTLVVASIFIAGLILYFTLRRAGPTQAAVHPEVSGESAPPVPALDTPGRAPATVPSAVTSEADHAFTLDVHPASACWINLAVDGKTVISRIVQPGERTSYKVRTAAELQVGDAAAFGFSIDGRPGRSLGSTGQVRTARITKDNLTEYIR
jgi:cytoskeletal protein RodZ